MPSVLQTAVIHIHAESVVSSVYHRHLFISDDNTEGHSIPSILSSHFECEIFLFWLYAFYIWVCPEVLEVFHIMNLFIL